MARNAVPFTDMTPGNKNDEMESNVIFPSRTSTQWMDLVEIRDVNYLAMKRHFFMTGQRQASQPVLLTHQLLAQLSLLRDERQ